MISYSKAKSTCCYTLNATFHSIPQRNLFFLFGRTQRNGRREPNEIQLENDWTRNVPRNAESHNPKYPEGSFNNPAFRDPIYDSTLPATGDPLSVNIKRNHESDFGGNGIPSERSIHQMSSIANPAYDAVDLQSGTAPNTSMAEAREQRYAGIRFQDRPSQQNGGDDMKMKQGEREGHYMELYEEQSANSLEASPKALETNE